MNWSEETTFQALALSGGGYRGLFTARALQVIEDELKAPIGRNFDLTFGTSIGGIVALAVAFEVPMSKVVSVFTEYGENIFPLHTPPSSGIGQLMDIWRYAKKPRYDTAASRPSAAIWRNSQQLREGGIRRYRTWCAWTRARFVGPGRWSWSARCGNCKACPALAWTMHLSPRKRLPAPAPSAIRCWTWPV